MKCPNCGYVSFNYLDQCKKCGKDLTSFKQKKGIWGIKPGALSLYLASSELLSPDSSPFLATEESSSPLASTMMEGTEESALPSSPEGVELDHPLELAEKEPIIQPIEDSAPNHADEEPTEMTEEPLIILDREGGEEELLSLDDNSDELELIIDEDEEETQ